MRLPYLTAFIAQKIYELDDNISDLVDDLASRKLISDEDKEKVMQFFQLTESKCIELAKQSQKDDYETKSIPVLDNIDYSVHLRLIPKKPFDPSHTNIEEYSPEAEDLILSSVIELVIADGKNKNVISFQLNFTELEGLIVRLQACQKEMRLLQNYQESNKINK